MSKEIYFSSCFGLGAKRDGFFEQQLGTWFLTFKTSEDVLLACFSGMGFEHDKVIKMTGIVAISIFLNKIEFINK